MIYLKTDDEIALLRASNMLVSNTLAELAKYIQPGVTTQQLDQIAETFIRDHGALPTFKGFPSQKGPPFPASICTSVNDCVIHGVPNDKPLQDGDILSIDCGVRLDGFCGDSAYTFSVGEISETDRRLMHVTKESLYKAIEVATIAHRVGDIGHVIQKHCEDAAYNVVREFVGHGIGREMHEEPLVPNYGESRSGQPLKHGLCIAIEPMVVHGNRNIYIDRDSWSVRTKDGRSGVHYEHSIAITKTGPHILSSFEVIETVLKEKEY